MTTDTTPAANARELLRCLYSHIGGLEQIRERLPDSPEARGLASVLEGGMPEVLHIAEQLALTHGVELDAETASLSYARGYQVMCLMAEEERTGERNPEAWKEHPGEFMERLRAASPA